MEANQDISPDVLCEIFNFWRVLVSLLGQMAFSSALKLIAGIETGETAAELKAEFFNLVRGTLSLAVDLPGTAYRRGLQASSLLLLISLPPPPFLL